MKRNTTILLADDNQGDVDLVRAALADSGLSDESLVVVSDGSEVLDYLYCRGQYSGRPEAYPALILLDLKMPRVDGLDVLQVVKSDPSLKTIPVVMLTSSREDSDLNRSYQLGVNAYVVKPVNFTEVMETIKKVVHFWTILNERP